MFPATAVRDTHLMQPAGHEVVGQMQPPVVAGPAGLAETAGIDEEEAPGRTGHGWRGHLGDSAQFTQEPQQPVVTGAQALAPGGLRDVGEPDQDRPGTQPARR